MHKNKAAKLISEDLNNIDRIDRKHIESLCEACTKVIQQCSKKELKVLDLKWQPHYSTVFKQLKSLLESILNTDSSKALDKLNTIPYLLALKNEMFNLFNSFSKFVLENGALIGSKDTNQRKNFFIKVVHFQFLCHEIQAYFPSGIYSPSKFKISKLPARDWWNRMFGEITFIELDTFVNKFKEDYPFINQAEIFSFKNSINFTATNFTTTFEFDLFTRLYSPWEIVQQAWRIIYNHPGYLHFSTYGDTKDILSHYLDRPGTYVFRVSCKDLGYWTIGYVKGSKDMGQIKVDKTNLIEALVEGRKKNMYLYPNGEFCNPDLSNLSEFRKEIIVKNDDLQLYDCFEDFKECKICRESEKDLQLESCGHQICHGCFKLLRKYDKKLCPFCNQKILSTTKIVNIQKASVSVYVDHNPAQEANAKCLVDSTYADMSSDNKDDTTGYPGDNGMVESRSLNFLSLPKSLKRLNASIRSKDVSTYSNDSDDAPGTDFSSLPLPEVPSRPPRDRPVYVAFNQPKPGINYPPMQKTKSSDSQLNKTAIVSEPLKHGTCPPSPLYAEMVSSIVPTKLPEVKVDELYSDITDPDYCDETVPVPVTVNTNRSTKPGITTVTSSCHLTVTATGAVTSQEYLDDTYMSPIELAASQNHEVDQDDIYCDPIVNNITPVAMSRSPAIIATAQMDLFDDVYSNLDDIVVVNHNDNDDEGDRLFSKWSERDVSRAMRVARQDRLLALDILEEFVNKC